MIDNVGIIFGNSLDAQVSYQTAFSALTLSTNTSITNTHIYLVTGASNSEIRSHTTGSASKIELRTTGADSNIDFYALNGDVRILTANEFYSSSDTADLNASSTFDITAATVAAIAGTTGVTIGSSTGNVALTANLGDVSANAAGIKLTGVGSSAVFQLFTGGEYFEMKTNQNVVIRIYIGPSTPINPSTIPEGSLYFDTYQSGGTGYGTVRVIRNGAWVALYP